jgi:hypothetical protein
MMTRQAIFGAVCMAACLAFGGCFKEKRDITLNPDGSGKLTYEYRGPLPPSFTENKTTPQEQARQEVARILSASAGVTTWKDVTYELDNAGDLVFKGTAYFRDLNKVEVHCGGSMSTRPAWTVAGGVPHLELADVEKAGQEKADVKLPKLSDAELAQQIRAVKAEFKRQLAMMTALLPEYRSEWVFALPGAPEKTVNFQKAEGRPNTVQVIYEGPKMLAVMQQLADDDAFWKAQIAAGRSVKYGPENDVLNEKLFGTRGPIATDVTAPLAPRFDYAAEVAEAQSGFKAMTEQLKLEVQAPAAPPAAGGAFKSLRVGGVRLIAEADNEKHIAPFNWSKGYTLALIGELPGSVLTVKEGVVQTAVADNGDNLLPARDWDRKLNWPQLSSDRSTVVFDVPMQAPGPNVQGIKEVSGTLTYVVAGGTKEVDLGTLALKAGAEAKELGAKIEFAGKSRFKQGASEVRLLLKVDFNGVKSVKFLDAAGQPIIMKSQGYSGANNAVTFTYEHDGDLPAEARIVAELYDDLKNFTIAFKIENIDLLGRPMK